MVNEMDAENLKRLRKTAQYCTSSQQRAYGIGSRAR